MVKKEITIKAKPEEVWDALTNPEKTKEYFFKSEVHSNLKSGSRITCNRNFLFFFTFKMNGKILAIEVPIKIVSVGPDWKQTITR